MTLLEVVGMTALAAIVARILYRAFKPSSGLVSIEFAQKQLDASLKEAFESGMLCAADIVTHSGEEELAGRIRKTVEYVRAANDN